MAESIRFKYVFPDDYSPVYVNAGVIMTPETARLIYTWLGEHIARIEAEQEDHNANVLLSL